MPALRRLYSASAEFQLVEALKRSRQQRHRQGRFFVEGVRSINQSVEGGWEIDSFLFRRGRLLSPWAKALLSRGIARTHLEVPPALLDRLSEKDAPSELIAIVTTPPDDLDRIPLPADALVVVFDRPSSPGNLGTMIRSCGALGAHGLIVTGHAADVYHPKTIRASMGSLFSVPVVRIASPRAVEEWLATARASLPALSVVCCSSDGELAAYAHDFTGPTLLVVGNEAHGIGGGLRALCDASVRVPMSGAADSLNVATAGAIVLYEAARQRRA